jgi:hypothetical protein
MWMGMETPTKKKAIRTMLPHLFLYGNNNSSNNDDDIVSIADLCC